MPDTFDRKTTKTEQGVTVLQDATPFLRSIYSALDDVILALSPCHEHSVSINCDSDGLSAFTYRDLGTDEQIVARDALNAAARVLDERLASACDRAALYKLAALRRPSTAGEALMTLLSDDDKYAAACTQWAALSGDAAMLEDESGRTRRNCGRIIQENARQAHVAQGGTEATFKPIADTPLDKMAGDHPDYVVLRQRITATIKARDEALAVKETFLQRCLTSRAVWEAFARDVLPFTTQERMETAVDQKG